MDSEWNYNEEFEPMAEHHIDPEFTPEYPDVSFFKESYVTMQEENIFQGEIPQGETPKKERADRRSDRSRFSWFRKLLGSAMRGGAAIAAAAMLVVNAAEGDSSAFARKVRVFIDDLHQNAFEKPNDYSPEELGALWDSEPLAPHQYDYSRLVVLREATCTESGLSCYVCADCGVQLPVITNKAHEPMPAVREKIVKPDCVHDGSCEEVVLCEVCGTELSRTPIVLDALGHTEDEVAVENVIDPGCVEDGSQEEVIYCKVCGEELSRTVVVLDALGHTEDEPVIENVVDPGCVEDGSQEEVVYCKVCGEELSRTVVVLEATGHTEDEPVIENEVAASCTGEGSRDDVVYCAVCGEELSRETEIIEALGHSYSARVTSPTCTAQGYTTYTCSRCGNSYRSNTTAALGHSYTAKVTSPTCTAQGYTTHTCSRCGSSYKDTYTAALGHTYTFGYLMSDDETPTACNRCGAYGFTISLVDATHIRYTLSQDLLNQANAQGFYALEWGDVTACENNYYGEPGSVAVGFRDSASATVTGTSGVIHLDFTPVSGTTYYYTIYLRLASSGSSDDVYTAYPQGGGYRTYKQP